MKIGFACDHRGFNLKNFLMEWATQNGHVTVDYGTYSQDSCDYPDYSYALAKGVRDKKVERGVLICYTGVGSSIAANKVKGVRAALVGSVRVAALTRKHNNSNIIVLASGFLKREEARKIVKKWLTTDFEGGRHLRRLRKIKKIEEKEDV